MSGGAHRLLNCAVALAVVGAGVWGTVTVRELIAPVTDSAASTSGQVVRVVDGDTADVRLDSGEDVRVRILGIDTPETVKPDAAVQCWGPEASAWAHTMLDDAAVTLTGDPRSDDVDRYGRSLRYLTLPDGTDYGVLAARSGMARAYVYGNTPIEKTAEIAGAQEDARSAGIGLWGPPCNGEAN
ncbi:nuclease [Rhodococcus erythropolis]|nr:nuclease [Rhodococcus erythropolis]